MSTATLLSRILGMVRDQVLTTTFGAGAVMDAFNVATRIPNLVRDLFAEGAMSAAFVPTFTRHLTTKGEEDAWRLGSNVINALIVVTGVLALAGMVFARPLVELYTDANFAHNVERTTQLTRWTVLFLTMVAIAVAQAGMLNSLRHFFVPAVSPAMYNVAVIASVYVIVPFCPLLGLEPIVGVAIGTLLGGILQIAVQWPALRRAGFRYRPVLDFRDPGLGEVLLLMGPGTIGVAAAQINLLVNTSLATSQGDGAVTFLQNAFRLMYLPIGIFGVSVATAAIPELARHAASDAYEDMRATLSSGLRMMLMLSLPSMVGLMVLAEPIIQLLFEYKNFIPRHTEGTAWALMMYAPGLIGYSIVKIASPSFYALKDARTPVTISIVTVTANVALNLWLVRVMGYGGLALGTAIASLVNAALLVVLLSRRIGGIDGWRVMVAFTKIALASLAMGAAAFWTERQLSGVFGDATASARIVNVGASIAAGVIVLMVSAKALRLAEFEDALGMVLRKLRGARR